MSDYEIKPYEKGFEIEQEQVGIEVAKSFVIPHQTNADRLKEVYSREDFDPETRLYAFNKGKMIGFLTSRVLPDDESGIKRANLTLPSVLAEHSKAEKLLYEKAIAILKQKGVKVIRSQFGVTSNKDAEVASNMGYKKVEENYFAYSIDLDGVDTSIKYENLIEFDYKKHQEPCVKIISEEYGRDVEWANDYYARIKEQQNVVRIHKIIEENGEIKAYLNLIENPLEPSIIAIQVIHASNQEYMKQLLSYLAAIVKKKNYKRIQCAYTDESDIELSKYKPIKFSLLGKTGLYEKEI